MTGVPEVIPHMTGEMIPIFAELYARIYAADTTDLKMLTRQGMPLVIEAFNIVKNKFEANPQVYIKSQLDIYGLAPGQEVARGGGFGLESIYHHGVYLGDGLIAEVAATTCPVYVKKLMSPWRMAQQCFGLSELVEFDRVAQNAGFPLMGIYYDNMDDQDPKVVEFRLRNMYNIFIRHADGWMYNPFVNNCQHASSSVAAGVCHSRQIPWNRGALKTTMYPLPRRGAYNEAGCANGTCAYRHQSIKGCVCESDIYTTLATRSKWCYVDATCGAHHNMGQDKGMYWDYVSKEKAVPTCRRSRKAQARLTSTDPLTAARGHYQPCNKNKKKWR